MAGLPACARRDALGEVVAHAARDALPGLLRTLRDDPRFAFEQLMELCGVDWPDRAERFDVVYCLLSVSRNQRLRVIVTTDADHAGALGACASIRLRRGGSGRHGICSGSCSPASPICAAS